MKNAKKRPFLEKLKKGESMKKPSKIWSQNGPPKKYPFSHENPDVNWLKKGRFLDPLQFLEGDLCWKRPFVSQRGKNHWAGKASFRPPQVFAAFVLKELFLPFFELFRLLLEIAKYIEKSNIFDISSYFCEKLVYIHNYHKKLLNL